MKSSKILIPIIAATPLLLFLKSEAATIQSQLKGKIDIVVASDGSGDYKKVQEAINAVPDSNKGGRVIFLKKGTYKEKVVVPFNKTNITMVGEDVDDCVIVYSDHSSNTVKMNTFTSYTFKADAPDFTAMNITFQNTSKSGQAVALHANGDRQVYLHCRLLGWQDTYFNNIRSRHYLKDCYIEGATDFIFGFGTDLFDSCLIKELKDGAPITAAATAINRRFGYVFRNCKFTSNGGPFSLGRPWWNYARVVIFKSWEDPKLSSAGWSGNRNREATGYFREYKCTGGGFKPGSRAKWAGQLTDEEAQSYELDTIFSHLSFPQGKDAATAEIDFILKRWTNPPTAGYMIAIAEDVLKCGRDTFPPVPTADWQPRPDTNSVYAVIKGNIPPFLFTGDFIPVQTQPPFFPVNHDNLLIQNSFRNQIGFAVNTENFGNLKLSIYDMLGKEVFIRDVPTVSRGRNKVWFDGSLLRPGIYVFKANVNGVLSHGKIKKRR